ncbi:hypothetical protein Q5752_000064 [Cryptotrichosporon argae]
MSAFKRRFFFSSSRLPSLPLVAPSTAPKASSTAVLAALEPEKPASSASQARPSESREATASVVEDEGRKTRPKPASAAFEKAPRKPRTMQQTVVRRTGPTRTTKVKKVIKAVAKVKVGLKRGQGRAKGASRTAAEGPAKAGKARGRPRKAASEGSVDGEPHPARKKEFMAAGLYCQDATPPPDRTLVSRAAAASDAPSIPRGRKRTSTASASASTSADGQASSFPPLPLDHGYRKFFETEHEFQLPYNIMWESERGVLDGKKRPPLFQKLRSNAFPERAKTVADAPAVCKCDPEVGCGDNCINKLMSYLCGKECLCGDLCDNRSLTKRKPKLAKVKWTGSRGFGLFAAEDIKAGEFVIDYRGEVVHKDTFIERIHDEYKGQRNFYALAYDRDEVIDSGLRGNDARFINHGCRPNLEVRKYQCMGDGYEEFEIGMWAIKDIAAGEELFYDYNFENFAVQKVDGEDLRTICQCGAPNCIGFLGRRAGEKSAKEIAADLDAADRKRERLLEMKRNAMRRLRAANKRKKPAKTFTEKAKEKAQKKAAAKPRTKALADKRERESEEARNARLRELKLSALVKARAVKQARAEERRAVEAANRPAPIVRPPPPPPPPVLSPEETRARLLAIKVEALKKARAAKALKRMERFEAAGITPEPKKYVISKVAGKLDIKTAAMSDDPERAERARELLRVKAETLARARAAKKAKKDAMQAAWDVRMGRGDAQALAMGPFTGTSQPGVDATNVAQALRALAAASGEHGEQDFKYDLIDPQLRDSPFTSRPMTAPAQAGPSGSLTAIESTPAASTSVSATPAFSITAVSTPPAIVARPAAIAAPAALASPTAPPLVQSTPPPLGANPPASAAAPQAASPAAPQAGPSAQTEEERRVAILESKRTSLAKARAAKQAKAAAARLESSDDDGHEACGHKGVHRKAARAKPGKLGKMLKKGIKGVRERAAAAAAARAAREAELKESKRAAIARRNGAPMGYAYEIVRADEPAAEPADAQDTPRQRRVARRSDVA